MTLRENEHQALHFIRWTTYNYNDAGSVERSRSARNGGDRFFWPTLPPSSVEMAFLARAVSGFRARSAVLKKKTVGVDIDSCSSIALH